MPYCAEYTFNADVTETDKAKISEQINSLLDSLVDDAELHLIKVKFDDNAPVDVVSHFCEMLRESFRKTTNKNAIIVLVGKWIKDISIYRVGENNEQRTTD